LRLKLRLLPNAKMQAIFNDVLSTQFPMTFDRTTEQFLYVDEWMGHIQQLSDIQLTKFGHPLEFKVNLELGQHILDRAIVNKSNNIKANAENERRVAMQIAAEASPDLKDLALAKAPKLAKARITIRDGIDPYSYEGLRQCIGIAVHEHHKKMREGHREFQKKSPENVNMTFIEYLYMRQTKLSVEGPARESARALTRQANEALAGYYGPAIMHARGEFPATTYRL